MDNISVNILKENYSFVHMHLCILLLLQQNVRLCVPPKALSCISQILALKNPNLSSQDEEQLAGADLATFLFEFGALILITMEKKLRDLIECYKH